MDTKPCVRALAYAEWLQYCEMAAVLLQSSSVPFSFSITKSCFPLLAFPVQFTILTSPSVFPDCRDLSKALSKVSPLCSSMTPRAQSSIIFKLLYDVSIQLALLLCETECNAISLVLGTRAGYASWFGFRILVRAREETISIEVDCLVSHRKRQSFDHQHRSYLIDDYHYHIHDDV